MLDIKNCISTSYAMAKEDGVCLYEELLDEMKKQDAILLDFQGITRATSLFFNESLCKIAGSLGLEEYKEKITVENMSDPIKIIYLRALNLTLKKMEDPSIYNNELKEGINANATN